MLTFSADKMSKNIKKIKDCSILVLKAMCTSSMFIFIFVEWNLDNYQLRTCVYHLSSAVHNSGGSKVSLPFKYTMVKLMIVNVVNDCQV